MGATGIPNNGHSVGGLIDAYALPMDSKRDWRIWLVFAAHPVPRLKGITPKVTNQSRQHLKTASLSTRVSRLYAVRSMSCERSRGVNEVLSTRAVKETVGFVLGPATTNDHSAHGMSSRDGPARTILVR
jgi:hypothetical protein